MRFDPDTGKLLYVTDNQQGHDGSDEDGAGNVVTIVITATDPDSMTATSNINIRLNTPPTEIRGTNTAEIDETEESTAEDLVTDLDVQDNNDPTHEFGQYTWAVSDDRFKITADTADSSQATLSVLAEKAFPADTSDPNPTVAVKVTATEKASGEKVEFTVTVTINNNTDNDPPTPVEPTRCLA